MLYEVMHLVTSDAWIKEVHPKVEAKGFKPLFYVVIDSYNFV